jgi:rhodanese-related sulfurtransferase
MQGIFVGWIRDAFWLLVILGGLGVAVNGLRPDTIALISMSPIAADRSNPDSPVAEISLDEAWEKHEKGEVLFIDARSPEDFQAGHIKGAVSLPDHDFDEVFPQRVEEMEKWAQLVAYCDGRDCVLGHALAEKLYQLGFRNASYLVNGWTAWRERGLPTEP